MKYSWAIPTEEVIRYMAEQGPIIEIGAGTGYWAMMLTQAGADVLAFDDDPPDGSFPVDDQESFEKMREHYPKAWHGTQEAWFDVRPISPLISKEMTSRNLMVRWSHDSEYTRT